MIVKIVFLNILFLLLSGCAVKQDISDTKAEHIIKSNELRVLMRDMNMVVNDEYKSELERDNTRRRYAIRLAQNIKDTSYIMQGIIKDKLDADESDMKLLTQYAKDLNKKAEVIDQIAQNYEMERLDSALDNVKRTCNACHSKFRGY